MGTVALYWLGQMGLLIDTGNTRICVDYFASPLDGRQTPPPFQADKLTDIDMFLGTHDHIDHIDRLHEMVKTVKTVNMVMYFFYLCDPFAERDR